MYFSTCFCRNQCSEMQQYPYKDYTVSPVVLLYSVHAFNSLKYTLIGSCFSIKSLFIFKLEFLALCRSAAFHVFTASHSSVAFNSSPRPKMKPKTKDKSRNQLLQFSHMASVGEWSPCRELCCWGSCRPAKAVPVSTGPSVAHLPPVRGNVFWRLRGRILSPPVNGSNVFKYAVTQDCFTFIVQGIKFILKALKRHVSDEEVWFNEVGKGCKRVL